ncbi:RrF2 family transcriptional regulator [Candidatus Nitrospira bockiana]
MRVSLKATYGIMAAVDLALQNGALPVQSKSIARRQGIPVRFLEQVLHAMKKAGLIESTRGAQGGYILSKPASELSLAAIVEALDGPLSVPRDPRRDGRRLPERTKLESLLAPVWERVRRAELEVLSAVTVHELMERYHELEQQHALMYHI